MGGNTKLPEFFQPIESKIVGMLERQVFWDLIGEAEPTCTLDSVHQPDVTAMISSLLIYAWDNSKEHNAELDELFDEVSRDLAKKN